MWEIVFDLLKFAGFSWCSSCLLIFFSLLWCFISSFTGVTHILKTKENRWNSLKWLGKFPLPGRDKVQTAAKFRELRGGCCDISRRICCYFWVLLSPEVPLIRALGTRRDDLWCRVSNPGSQSQQLLPCAPFPLPGFLVSALWKWNRKIAECICMSRMLVLPRLGSFLSASGTNRHLGSQLMFKHWFYGAGARSWWGLMAVQSRWHQRDVSLCPWGFPWEPSFKNGAGFLEL